MAKRKLNQISEFIPGAGGRLLKALAQQEFPAERKARLAREIVKSHVDRAFRGLKRKAVGALSQKTSKKARTMPRSRSRRGTKRKYAGKRAAKKRRFKKAARKGARPTTVRRVERRQKFHINKVSKFRRDLNTLYPGGLRVKLPYVDSFQNFETNPGASDTTFGLPRAFGASGKTVTNPTLNDQICQMSVEDMFPTLLGAEKPAGIDEGYQNYTKALVLGMWVQIDVLQSKKHEYLPARITDKSTAAWIGFATAKDKTTLTSLTADDLRAPYNDHENGKYFKLFSYGADNGGLSHGSISKYISFQSLAGISARRRLSPTLDGNLDGAGAMRHYWEKQGMPATLPIRQSDQALSIPAIVMCAIPASRGDGSWLGTLRWKITYDVQFFDKKDIDAQA